MLDSVSGLGVHNEYIKLNSIFRLLSKMITRSKLEIYLDLLLSVSQHTELTTIAEKVKLTSSAAKDHLAFLASQGFVATQVMDDKTIKYELSGKGYEALMAFLSLSRYKEPILEKPINA